jgi:hypothetical protein
VERGGAPVTRLLSLLPRLRPAAEHVVAVAAVATAMVPWLAIVEPTAAWIGVIGAVGGATLLGLLLTRVLGVGSRVEAAVSGAGLLAFLLLAVVRDPLGVPALGRGIVDGLPRILSTSLPILDAAWIGVPGAIVGWTVAGSVTSLVARTRQVAAPVGLVFGAFLAGYAVTLAGVGGDPNALALREVLLLATLTGLLALLRTRQRVPAGQRLRAAGRVGLAGLLLLGALGLASVAATSAPYLRDEPVAPSISRAAQVREPVSPLLVTSRLRTDHPERVLGEVAVDGAWPGYVPFAVLDRYDGRVWGLTQVAFTPTGGTLPVALPVGGGSTARLGEVDVDGVGGWVPFVARPSSIAGEAVLHNGGAALQLADPSSRVSYRLQLAQGGWTLDDGTLTDATEVARAAVPPLEVPDPSGDRRPAGERLCRLLATAQHADAERAIAGEPCGERGPATVAFLRELAAALESGRSVPEDLLSGGRTLDIGSEALSDLLDLVSQWGTQGAVGTPEQFASAYALIAADYGLPARVVTGFRIPAEELGEPGTPVPFRGDQAWTWVEVPVEDVGWVVIDPSPDTRGAVEEQQQAAAEEVQEEAEAAEPERSVVGVDPSEVVGRAPAPEPRPPWLVALWAVAGMAGLVTLLLLSAWLRRWRRRRQRRSGAPQEQVVGAWHEVLDALHDAGLREVETLAAAEVVAAVRERVPATPDEVEHLAEVANRAVFSSRPIADDEAARAWQVVRHLRRGLRRSSSVGRRLLAAGLPAPADLHTPPAPARSRPEPVEV